MARKFQWLMGERASARQEEPMGEPAERQMGFTVCDPGGVPLSGEELIKWAAKHLEWDIVMRLVEVSTSRSEHVVVTPLAHVCVGSQRIPTWQQSWKVVSHAAVTFQVILAVEAQTPSVLRMRMTLHPSLEFPPVAAGLERVVRHYAGLELADATSDVGSLETRGRSYLFRPHPVWEPGRLPEEYVERVYYTTSRELRDMVAEALAPPAALH